MRTEDPHPRTTRAVKMVAIAIPLLAYQLLVVWLFRRSAARDPWSYPSANLVVVAAWVEEQRCFHDLALFSDSANTGGYMAACYVRRVQLRNGPANCSLYSEPPLYSLRHARAELARRWGVDSVVAACAARRDPTDCSLRCGYADMALSVLAAALGLCALTCWITTVVHWQVGPSDATAEERAPLLNA